MFLKKNKIYFKEDKWCLGNHMEESGFILQPVFKITYEGTLKAPFFSHCQSVFQGVIQIKDDQYLWIPKENTDLETVMQYLPELKVTMYKEAKNEY